MHIFLSYASEDRAIAEEIHLALLAGEHVVFFDKASLPPGGDYHARIESAIRQSDLFIFLVSPNSVAQGSYALTELKFARIKWPHPKGRLLSVRLHNTVWEAIPPYLKSVTVLEPEGSVPAEVVAAVAALDSKKKFDTFPRFLLARKVVGATFGGLFVLAVLLAASWSTIFPSSSTERRSVSDPSGGMKGADARGGQSPELNDCPEVTETDYSKYPVESKIVRRCPP